MGWEQSDVAFQTTNWANLRGLDGEEASAQLERLVDAYWPAVYSYLRRRGLDRERAAEVTQGFFADVVLARRLFAAASEARGKLRSLVLTALSNYCIDLGRRERARGNGAVRRVHEAFLDREDSLLDCEPGDPTVVFARRCQLAVVEEALRRCEAHYADSGKSGHWAAFEDRVLKPIIGRVTPISIEQVASVHGFRSPAEVSAAVQVVKRRLASLVLDVAAENGVDVSDRAVWGVDPHGHGC